MSAQERLIEQKKQEIEQKMLQAKMKQHEEASEQNETKTGEKTGNEEPLFRQQNVSICCFCLLVSHKSRIGTISFI